MGKEEFALPKFFSLDDKMLFANSKYILYKNTIWESQCLEIEQS